MAQPEPAVINSATLTEALLKFCGEHEKGITFLPKNETPRFVPYAHLIKMARLVLGSLQAKGLEPDAEVVIQLPDEYMFMVVFWACVMGRMVPIPVTPGYHRELHLKLTKIIKQIRKPSFITDRHFLHRIEGMYQREGLSDEYAYLKQQALFFDDLLNWQQPGTVMPASPEDLGFIQYSSGSTGDPKGVMLTHENLVANINAIYKAMEVTPHDSSLSWLPLTHDMGLIGFHLAPLGLGIQQYVMPTKRFQLYPLDWLHLTHQTKTTVLSSPNFGYRHVLQKYEPDFPYDWDLSHVRLIFNGAEPISMDLCHDFLQTMKPYGLKPNVMFPVYGLAEASLAVSFPPPKEPVLCVKLSEKLAASGEIHVKSGHAVTVNEFVDVGFPVQDCAIRICDDAGSELGENQIGHIHISGKSVTKGYYRNPKATEAVFTADGWLKTGDLGLLHEGRLTVTGRTKDVIFKNGQNYYAHDLESVAEGCPGIHHGKIAICGIFHESLENNEIVAFVQYRGSLQDFSHLAANLKKHIGWEFGLELDSVLPIKKIPRTTSGKLQRFLLEQQYCEGAFRELREQINQFISGAGQERKVDPPQGEDEVKLAKLWAEVLNVDPLDRGDEFFSLGGDSLKACHLVTKIVRTFHVRFELEALFEHSVFQDMAHHLFNAKQNSFDFVTRVEELTAYPLSSEQKRLYFLHLLHPDFLNNNIYHCLEICGDFQVDRMEQALEKVCRNEPVLRTVFKAEEDGFQQVICPEVQVKINEYECKQGDLQAFLRSLMRPFDLRRLPLFRMSAIRLGTKRFLLFLEMHHIITDGTSIGILFDQLFSVYMGFAPAEGCLRYVDYAVWQGSESVAREIEKQHQFWHEMLTPGIPKLELPLDGRRPVHWDESGDVVFFEVDEELTAKIRKLAMETRSTVSMVMLTTWFLTMAKYSGQRELLIGILAAGRNHCHLDRLLGMFVKTLVLRVDLDDAMPFHALLEQVKSRFFKLHTNQDFPFENLVREFAADRDLSRNPLFDVAFIYQNFSVPEIFNNSLEIKNFRFEHRTSQFDLTLEIFDRDNGLECALIFPTALFQRSSIERMAVHFMNLLAQACNRPGRTAGAFALATPQERQCVLHDFNATHGDIPKGTIVDYFEARVQRRPDDIALYLGRDRMSIRELNERANQVAHFLRNALSLQPDDLVGILVERSFDMMIGILGILKAGAGYLPLDPEHPKTRLAFILQDSGAKAVLTQKKFCGQLGNDINVWCLEDDLFRQQAGTNPSKITAAEHLAYAIYTSGTTGRPKGILVEHRSVLNTLLALQRAFPMGHSDRQLLKTTYTFDVSVHELFAWFIGDGALEILESGGELDPKKIYSVMEHGKVTHAGFSPSALKVFLETGDGKQYQSLNGLKFMFVAGEPFSLALNQLCQALSCCVVNLYGPTEASIYATAFPLSRSLGSGSIPIGKPLDNVRIYILDRGQQLLPPGVFGELCIAGNGLARGYLGNRALTEKSFPNNPFKLGTKIYRSGDLARWLPDGQLEFFGRIDQQLKIHGFRIEPGEIESCLLNHESVQEAHVQAQVMESGDAALAAFVVSKDKSCDPNQLRTFLVERLPRYMIPSHFVFLEALPLNASGKIDRERLPNPVSTATREGYGKARDQCEKVIVEIWEHVLKQENVGIHDHFFERGGHSLLVPRVMQLIEEKLGLSVDVRVLFETPTLCDFAQRVRAQARAAADQQDDWPQILKDAPFDIQSESFVVEDRGFQVWFTDAAPDVLTGFLDGIKDNSRLPHYVFSMAQYDQLTASHRAETAYASTQFSHHLGLKQDADDLAVLCRKVAIEVRRVREALNRQVGKPVKTYPCGHHPWWFAKKGTRPVLFASFPLERAVHRSRVVSLVNDLIAEQGLLRSVLNERKQFEEYGDIHVEDIPVCDLSPYALDFQTEALAACRNLMEQDLLGVSPIGNLLYNLCVFKLNHAEYRILFALDHIIADYESTHIVASRFKPLNAAGDHSGHERDVHPYDEFVALTIAGKKDPKYKLVKKLGDYKKFRGSVKKFQKIHQLGKKIVFSQPYYFQGVPAGCAEANFLGLGLAVANAVLSLQFSLERNPIRVLVSRRFYPGKNFYNTVGDFHDSLPVAFESGFQDPESIFQTYLTTEKNFAADNLYLSNLQEDYEIDSIIFKSPFNFNFLSKVTPEEEHEVLSKARTFDFVSYPIMSFHTENRLSVVFFHGLEPKILEGLHAYFGQHFTTFQIQPIELPSPYDGA